MYRIVREENKLTGRALYYIEEYRGFIFKSWTRDLSTNIDRMGPIGATSLDGVKHKLNIIKHNGGKIIHQTVDFLDFI